MLFFMFEGLCNLSFSWSLLNLIGPICWEEKYKESLQCYLSQEILSEGQQYLKSCFEFQEFCLLVVGFVPFQYTT